MLEPLHGEAKKIAKFFPHEWVNFNNKTYSLKWVYNEYNTANFITSYIKMVNAKTGNEVISACEGLSALPLNFVFAMKNGDIGYV
jgi:acyl-homoserine lactone acylase PvdQ